MDQKGAVFYEDRDSDCSDLPDLSEINFEEMDSNSDSDKVENRILFGNSASLDISQNVITSLL